MKPARLTAHTAITHTALWIARRRNVMVKFRPDTTYWSIVPHHHHMPQSTLSWGFLTLLTTVIMILAAQYAAIGNTKYKIRNTVESSLLTAKIRGSSADSPGFPVAIGPVSAFATSLARSAPRGAIISPCRSSSLSIGGVCARDAMGVGAKWLLLDMLQRLEPV